MIEAVVDAFNRGQHLMIEAGTGTGKSIGYLLPAAFWSNLNQRRVVVSTNTINLQDQLISKDIPELDRLLPFELKAAVLKGRRNYLCTRLFQQLRHRGPGSGAEMALFGRILVWLPDSESGDQVEISLRSQGERLAWDRLNSENEACTAEKCASEGCPLHQARRRAELAHILVVNHALLLADIASENRVLPEYSDLIMDEAHHLESAITNGLSFRSDRRYIEGLLDEVTRGRTGILAGIRRLVSDSLPRDLKSILESRMHKIQEEAKKTNTRLEEFFTTLEFFLGQFVSKGGQYSQKIRITPAVSSQPDYDQVLISWDNLDQRLKMISDGLSKLAGQIADISDSFDIGDGEDIRLALISLARNLFDTQLNINAIIAEPSESVIYWAEIFKGRLSLHAAPLHIGSLVEEHIFNVKETVILTSATLRTAAPGYQQESNFDYLRSRLHAQHANELAVGSPFDFKNSTLLLLPTDMPEPNQPGYQRCVEQAIVEVAQGIGGRTLVLFTSYNQLNRIAKAIEPGLRLKGVDVLSQSEGASRQRLLEQFKAQDSPLILLGTRSFWEGVDVPGAALQAVVIVKLPFDVPTDPIVAARSETFENPFFEYTIPETVLRFRQGFGRLIRRQDDEGLVVVLDKRVLTKRYGQAFLDALPECTVLRQRLDRIGEISQRWLNRDK
jgi:DNA polymerase-3 subunit epsilon/ATP-dependent DNA helicase DinG